MPLEVLNLPATGKVFEACITAEADDRGVTVTPTPAKQVAGPRKGQAKEVDNADGDEASDLGDSMKEWKALPASGSAASATSVDADVDTAVDDTDDELAAMTRAGGRVCRLGASVLRTSTAGTVAAAIVLSASGRWA